MEEEQSDEESTREKICPTVLHDVRVVGVVALERYSGCLKCTAKVVAAEDDPELGKCVKCEMLQCVDVAR